MSSEVAIYPGVKEFFDAATSTITYVVSDPDTKRAAVIDSVLDYDPKAARTSTPSADAIIAYA
jgi:glyoxylase-like metal-dependent hydrolase (beta-lactamase superfamily II)